MECDSRSKTPPTDQKTVLLVEDEEMVREVVTEYLTRAGYHVLVAKDGRQAVDIAVGYRGTIHLLLTNLGIPFLTGQKLAEYLVRTRPEIKVIFMTGYIEDPSTTEGTLVDQVPLLRKPFSMSTLVSTIESVLR